MDRANILVVGDGMVGLRILQALAESGGLTGRRVVVIGEERHRAYDRFHLSSLFAGAGPDDLLLGDDGLSDREEVELLELQPAAA